MDITRSGSQAFTPEQYAKVLNALRRLTKGGRATSVALLAEDVRMGGRTVRAIVAAADGVDILLGGDPNTYMLVPNIMGGRAVTAKLLHDANTLLARVARRGSYEGRKRKRS
jgi:hypothetical protein